MQRFSMITVSALLLIVVAARANDWPSWRGSVDGGRTPEPAPVTSLNDADLLWKVAEGGRTTPIVHDGRVYAITPIDAGTPMSRERVVCWDADTGKQIWEHRFPVFLTDIVENRVGWTSVVADPETGNVYAHGTGGVLFCFEGATGKIVWKRSCTEEFGRISGYGGRLINPVLDDDRVIVSFLNSGWGKQAKGAHRYFALDKKTGEVIWISSPAGQPKDTTYAMPVPASAGRRSVLIAPAADGAVYALDGATGVKLWGFPLSKRGLNVTPVVRRNVAYFSHSEENLDNTEMGRVVCVRFSDEGAQEVWRIDGVTAGYSSPALANGRLYFVTNNATLICADAETGRVHWEHSIGRVGKGSPVVTTDGVIYVGEQNGIFSILRDAGDRAVVLATKSFEGPDGLVDEMFGSPAVANGRVYFMTRYGTYCFGTVGDVEARVSRRPERYKPAAPAHMFNAQLCVRPFEATIVAGDEHSFRTQELRGSIYYDTPAAETATICEAPFVQARRNVITAAADAFFATPKVTLSAKRAFGDKLGYADARVRVVPKLPFTVGFDEFGEAPIPPGWIGVAAKTKIVEEDGNKMLMKLAPKERPSPPFMRIRVYATPPIEGGLDVRCDVKGTVKKSRRKTYVPDMGVINTRYRCFLTEEPDENSQLYRALRIDAWDPVPRFLKIERLAWDPDTWYTIRFEVRPVAGSDEVRCRAKVWKTGEPEPQAWQIDAVDPAGNREGAAGLYGYSNGTKPTSDGTRIYYDNFQVAPVAP